MALPFLGRRRGAQARVLSPEESREMAPGVPPTWYEQQPLLAVRGEVPFASGIGYVSSPFSSYYEKTWGVLPHADQARYRIVYRTVPAAHAAVDKLVEVATAKGFGLDVRDHDNPKGQFILDTVKGWLDVHPEFLQVQQVAAKDLLMHGTAYVEPCYPETSFDLVREGDVDAARKLPDFQDMKASGVFSTFHRYHPAFIDDMQPGTRVSKRLYAQPMVSQENPDRAVAVLGRGLQDAKGKQPGQPSALVWLKNLDFLTMRVRRDAWGNEYGAVQYLAVPPVAFDTSKVIIGRWNPTSTFYESAYGVSLFQSTIRTQEAIWQIENDLLVIGHALAKPPHQFTRGVINPDGRIMLNPSDAEWNSFQGSMSQRSAGDDLYLPPWVAASPINQQLTGSLGALIMHLNYHKEQRTIALRVPPQLLGVPEGSSRTTATVSASDFILTVQTLQASLGRMFEDVFAAILAPYKEMLGEDYEVPKVKWNPVMERDETVELGKVLQARQAGLITLGEARHLLCERGIFEVADVETPEGQAALAELEGEAQQAAARMRDAFGVSADGEAAEDDRERERPPGQPKESPRKPKEEAREERREAKAAGAGEPWARP